VGTTRTKTGKRITQGILFLLMRVAFCFGIVIYAHMVGYFS
jgi:hypothetical protein